MYYLYINLVTVYFPIIITLSLIKLAILGNWNELLQNDLEIEDDNVSVNSRMFAELKNEDRWSNLLDSGVDLNSRESKN